MVASPARAQLFSYFPTRAMAYGTRTRDPHFPLKISQLYRPSKLVPREIRIPGFEIRTRFKFTWRGLKPNSAGPRTFTSLS